DVSKSLISIFNIFSQANKYIEQTEPWAIAKDENKKAVLAGVMRNLLEAIRIGAELLQPFLPDCASKVLTALHVESSIFGDMENYYALKEGDTVDPLAILFPRLDISAELEKLSNM
ncbi:MAG: methionine--tRNA ligase, partial [Acetobacter sp.]|nr:methionine--tRNA ligase [Acetobacter sp.]